MDQKSTRRCLQKSNSAIDITKPIKCNQESGFIVGKPKLVPEYNLYKVPEKTSNFQTKFEAFKNKVYVDKTEDELKIFFYETPQTDPKTYTIKDLKQLKSFDKEEDKYNYLQNLSAARKRTYLDFKYSPAQAGTQGTEEKFIIGSNNLDKGKLKEKIKALKNLEVKDKTTIITKAIINSMLGNILPATAQAQAKSTAQAPTQPAPAPASADKEKEKKKKEFALNILNYENEVLRGNINNRLNQKEYKISTTSKKTERNFEGYIDNEDNVYADKGFFNLDETLIKALNKVPITLTTPKDKQLFVGQEPESQAKEDEEPLKTKLETYLKELTKPGSHKRELLKIFDEKKI